MNHSHCRTATPRPCQTQSSPCGTCMQVVVGDGHHPTLPYQLFIDFDLADAPCFSREFNSCVCRLQRSSSMAQMSTPPTATCALHCTGRRCEVCSELAIETTNGGHTLPTHHQLHPDGHTLPTHHQLRPDDLILIRSILLPQDTQMYALCWWTLEQALWRGIDGVELRLPSHNSKAPIITRVFFV